MSKFKEYKNASSFKNAFRSSVIQYDSYEKQILITSDSGGMVYFKNHPQLTEVKVNITVTYPVIESNADYVNGNVYTWVFTKNTNKGVYMLLEDENGRSVGGVNGNGEEKKPEEEKENPTPEDPNEDPTTPPGKTSEKQEKNESGIAKEFKLIQEKGKKHPYVVALIAIVVFLIIIVFSMRIKKS